VASRIHIDKDETFCIGMVDLRRTVDVVVGGVESALMVTIQKAFSDREMTGLWVSVDIVREQPDDDPARSCDSHPVCQSSKATGKTENGSGLCEVEGGTEASARRDGQGPEVRQVCGDEV
jgi:hypothetical protein